MHRHGRRYDKCVLCFEWHILMGKNVQSVILDSENCNVTYLNSSQELCGWKGIA